MEKKTYLERAVLEKLLTGRREAARFALSFAWGDVAAAIAPNGSNLGLWLVFWSFRAFLLFS